MKLNQNMITRIYRELALSEHTRIVIINNFDNVNIDRETYRNNLYLLGENNTIIWQVKTPLSRHPGYSEAFSYVKDVGGEIHAKTDCGTKFFIDKQTGIATEIGFEK